MLLFQKRFHEGLVSGAVRLTFRRWEKPHVKPGGRYRCHPIGVLVVDRLARVRLADITEADAAGAGFGSRAELLAYIPRGPGGPIPNDTQLWPIEPPFRRHRPPPPPPPPPQLSPPPPPPPH